MKNIKKVFAGLDAAGKTSFLSALEEKYSTLINIKPTLGPDRREMKIFGFTISNWDLGGQQTYRELYFEESDRYFTAVNALFYIIDIQDKKRVPESLDYLHRILKKFKDYNESPQLIVCMHKYDKDIQGDPEVNAVIRGLKERIDQIANGFPKPKIFSTTIFDKWSLMRAFAQGVVVQFPKRELIDQQLKDFARKTFSSAVLLLDEHHLVMGSNTEKEELLEVCEAIVPHVSFAVEKLQRYDIKAKNVVVTLTPGDYYANLIKGKQMVVLFMPLVIEGTRFALFSLTRNPKTMKLMLKHGNALGTNLESLLRSFYF